MLLLRLSLASLRAKTGDEGRVEAVRVGPADGQEEVQGRKTSTFPGVFGDLASDFGRETAAEEPGMNLD